MKLLIFTSDIGQENNSYYLIKNEDDNDKATFNYLSNIGHFCWDRQTISLEKDVKNKNIKGLFKKLKNLINQGYNCFRLDDNNNIIETNFEKF